MATLPNSAIPLDDLVLERLEALPRDEAIAEGLRIAYRLIEFAMRKQNPWRLR